MHAHVQNSRLDFHLVAKYYMHEKGIMSVLYCGVISSTDVLVMKVSI